MCLCDRLWTGLACDVGPIDDWTGDTAGGYTQLNTTGDTCEIAGLRPIKSASECQEAVRAINKFRRQRAWPAYSTEARARADPWGTLNGRDDCAVDIVTRDFPWSSNNPSGCSTEAESLPWGGMDRARWCTFTQSYFNDFPEAATEAGVVEAHWDSHGGTAIPEAKSGVYVYCHATLTQRAPT